MERNACLSWTTSNRRTKSNEVGILHHFYNYLEKEVSNLFKSKSMNKTKVDNTDLANAQNNSGTHGVKNTYATTFSANTQALADAQKNKPSSNKTYQSKN